MSALLALFMQVAVQSSSSRPTVKQADLDAIADACQAPREWFGLRDNELIFRARPDADPAKLKCALAKISALIAATNGDPIGDAHAPEDK